MAVAVLAIEFAEPQKVTQLVGVSDSTYVGTKLPDEILHWRRCPWSKHFELV